MLLGFTSNVAASVGASVGTVGALVAIGASVGALVGPVGVLVRALVGVLVGTLVGRSHLFLRSDSCFCCCCSKDETRTDYYTLFKHTIPIPKKELSRTAVN